MNWICLFTSSVLFFFKSASLTGMAEGLKIWERGGNNVIGIICPPLGRDKINYSAITRGGHAPSCPPPTSLGSAIPAIWWCTTAWNRNKSSCVAHLVYRVSEIWLGHKLRHTTLFCLLFNSEHIGLYKQRFLHFSIRKIDKKMIQHKRWYNFLSL